MLESLETLLAKKDGIEAFLNKCEAWVIAFGVLVVIGVGGETLLGFTVWWNNKKLHSAQQAIDLVRQQEIGQLHERTKLLDVQISKSESETEKAKLELAKLRKQNEPRRLTGIQRDRLVRAIQVDPGNLAIVSKLLDSESADFADDFNAAIHDGAHWSTVRIKNRLTERYGVSILTAPGTTAGRFDIERLDKALTDIGVEHDVRTVASNELASMSPNFEVNVLYLVIEAKPPMRPQIR